MRFATGASACSGQSVELAAFCDYRFRPGDQLRLAGLVLQLLRSPIRTRQDPGLHNAVLVLSDHPQSALDDFLGEQMRPQTKPFESNMHRVVVMLFGFDPRIR